MRIFRDLNIPIQPFVRRSILADTIHERQERRNRTNAESNIPENNIPESNIPEPKNLWMKMVKAFNDVWDLKEEQKCTIRQAAYMISVKKVAEVMKIRGWY